MEITPIGFEKASAKLTQEQLDRPVDVVVEPQPLETVVPVESVPAQPVKTEEALAPEVIPEPEVEEEKVPKSRFLTMSKRAIDAERAFRSLEAERAYQPVAEVPSDDDSLKGHFVELFGDNPTTEKLYRAELARLSSIEEKAAERAYERFSQRERLEEETINQRVASFDTAFEELATVEGKTEFTDAEQVAMLDIVEEYSPKDADGNLIGDYLLPLDKAYEIYKLNQEPVVSAKKAERNAVASLSGARSEGTPTVSNDADWKPGQWGQWREKLPN